MRRRRRNSLLPSSDSYQKHLCGRVPNRFFGSRIPANSVQQAMNHLKPHAMRTVRRPQLASVSSVPWYASQHVCPPRGWCWRKLPVPILEPPIAKEIHGCYCWMKLRQGPQVAGSDVRSQSTVMGTPQPVPRIYGSATVDTVAVRPLVAQKTVKCSRYLLKFAGFSQRFC